MSVSRFTMCYKHSFMLCSHAIIVQSRYRIPNLHFITRTHYPIVLLFYLDGCTSHFVLSKRHLNAVFPCILFTVHILFIRILPIGVLFSFAYFSFVHIFHSYSFYSYTFFTCLLFIRILLIRVLFIRILIICILSIYIVFAVYILVFIIHFIFIFFTFHTFHWYTLYLHTFNFILFVSSLHSRSLSHAHFLSLQFSKVKTLFFVFVVNVFQ